MAGHGLILKTKIYTILAKASLLGDTLMEAVGIWLENNKTPGRKVGELDNRGSNYYLALYWAERLAARDSAWNNLAVSLKKAEAEITKDLVDCQGVSVDVGGYYRPSPQLAQTVMRPSKAFNDLMDNMESML